MRKAIKLFSCLASFVIAGVFSHAMAQTAAATPAAPTVAVDGLVDTYYSYNFTNSQSMKVGAGNVGTFFNTNDGSYSVALGEVDIKATQGAGTGVLSLVTGQNNGNLGLSAGADILQAYASYVSGEWTFSGGRFVTWLGNEVIQSKSNWNYSRSDLFWYSIPLWHQGLSIAYNSSDSKFGITGYATNGWNNTTTTYVPPMTNFGQTYGLQVSLKPDSTFNVTLNGIAGPLGSSGVIVPYSIAGNARYVGEAVIAYNPNSSWSFALDAVYGGVDVGAKPVTLNDGKTTTSTYTLFGAALYGRYQIQSDWAVALRLEEVKDAAGKYGIYGLGPQVLTSGTNPNDVEARTATLTVEHNFTNNLLVRLEGRMDMAYSGGTQYGPVTPTSTATVAGPFANGSGTQTTATMGAVYSF